nr:65-kDa microtubule-associated protein 3-like [Ipomoea batatas]
MPLPLAKGLKLEITWKNCKMFKTVKEVALQFTGKAIKNVTCTKFAGWLCWLCMRCYADSKINENREFPICSEVLEYGKYCSQAGHRKQDKTTTTDRYSHSPAFRCVISRPFPTLSLTAFEFRRSTLSFVVCSLSSDTSRFLLPPELLTESSLFCCRRKGRIASDMYNHQNDQSLRMETTCCSLLSELQKIWDEIGEPEIERDKMLCQLEQECLEAYRRKVDQASRSCAQLRQAVAESEAELVRICGALGEQPVNVRQSSRSLKTELQAIMPLLEEMKKRKLERKHQFSEVLDQIDSVLKDLGKSRKELQHMIALDESDLSLRRLEDMKNHLLSLQKEKSDRLKQVLDHLESLNSLCIVLGIDFKNTIGEIHPTLGDSSALKSLQDLATTIVELWNLMDMPVEEQQLFHNVTRAIAASESELTEPNALSLDLLKSVEIEVSRLQEMKSSKMKEVLLKKRITLEELCRKAHLAIDDSIEFSDETIDSGAIDPSHLLEQIEIQISKVKEEAFSRKEILEKVEKWLAACEEESWLEEYNRNDNRYNGGRGTHLMLKRAEKARALVNKIPGMLEALTSRAKGWERERGVPFLYDGVSILSMLEQYGLLKVEKELERQRQRDQKKLQGQLMAEQEALFGSKRSPSQSGKKNSVGGASNKRISVGGALLQTPHTERAAVSSHSLKKINPVKQQALANVTQNYVALSSGRRESSMHAKQPSCTKPNLQKTEPTQRKPLSPISSLSFNTTSANIMDKISESEELRETPASLSTTPIKNVSGIGANATPKTMPIPMPSTPASAASIAMQMAMTPAPVAATTPPIVGHANVEYSYEEMWAGFLIPRLH